MRSRPLTWLLVSVACFLGALYFWRLGDRWQAKKAAGTKKAQSALANPIPGRAAVAPPEAAQQSVRSASTAPLILLSLATNNVAANNVSSNASPLRFRLTNSVSTAGQLARKRTGVLLQNALIDTAQGLNFSIPEHLRSQGDPGTYIVQSRGALDEAFRTMLRAAGGSIVSYIPNNAYLVRINAGGAQQLSGQPETQSVLPFEPYYKLDLALLPFAVERKPLPGGTQLNVVTFADARETVLAELQRRGITVISESRSPFGPILHVQPLPDSLPLLAGLSGVQSIERASQRTAANDLSRVKIGGALDPVVPTNYLGLTGTNIKVGINDSGVDATHPDLLGRVFGANLTDTVGHGTHVAGIIAGSGFQSMTLSNVSGSIMPATTNQFRGMAPGALLFSQPLVDSDFDLQERTASSNVFISNNSWNYVSQDYDIAAASYDAAVRDALPELTGSQPVLFVFAAGNNGSGTDDGLSGTAGSIQSPATAKNVITVGALEQQRNITNLVKGPGVTNGGTAVWRASTDSDDKVASFSARGNVGRDIEGEFGRFKPDVVAPGTFVVSTRSSQWNERAYYNPTNFHFSSFFDQTVQTNGTNLYSIFVPANTVQLIINAFAFDPVVDLPIYLRANALPTAGDFQGFNLISIAPNPVAAGWFYGIGNPTNKPVKFDVFAELVTTNDLGNYFEVLSNLNNSLSSGTSSTNSSTNYYRYESGTSMAAGDVSGALALFQEYFQGRGMTNSPALMKALLINGARSSNPSYDLQVKTPINYQGWGLINLTNSLPSVIGTGFGTPAAMFVFDQSTNSALATGQSRTIRVDVAPEARNDPLRVTIVWTDPPGNPAAAIKLVNNLDLVVTNMDSTPPGSDPIFWSIYFGNTFPSGNDFTAPWDATVGDPDTDLVNNVENVYIQPPLDSQYSITVLGKNVNVNAVSGQSNNVVQDYALVVSSGDGSLTNAITLSPLVTDFTNAPQITVMTNGFDSGSGVEGQFLTHQRVGASPPLLGTNTIVLPGSTNGLITVGITNQWHFYVVTNTGVFTNAAFVTFLPPNLAVPRMGATNEFDQNATRVESDIDLYVSTDPALLQLNRIALAGSLKSLNRGGTEIVATNTSQNDVFYIGVKAEDQEAAEYSFLSIFSELPFDERDEDGNATLRGVPTPQVIPDGTPVKPGAATILGLALKPIKVRRVVVTNTVTHQNFGDLLGNLSHNRKFVVLNNHSFGNGNIQQQMVFEDNGEHNIPTSRPSDGPGSLRNFIGEEGAGVWLLNEIDNSTHQTGRVDRVTIKLEPQDQTNGVALTVEPNSFVFDFIDVPPEATNLTVCVANTTVSALPVQLFIRHNELPSQGDFDYTKTINPPGPDCLSIGTGDLPPLRPGRYYIGVFNPNGTAQDIRIQMTLGISPFGIVPVTFGSTNATPVKDDAVTQSKIFVGEDRRIASIDVGVRLDHSRASDVVLTLINPQGQRYLLFENRGATTTNGLGAGTTITNVFPQTSSGGPIADTNLLSTGTTSGTLVIDYQFFTEPDTLHVYYDGALLFDSGLINGAGQFNIPFNGASTDLMIVMNEGNNTNSTAWTYTATVVTEQFSYLRFTESTNLAQVPIKFDAPPFGGIVGPSASLLSGFEVAPGDYLSGSTVDGWTVTTNQVSVLNDPFNINSGTNYLALARGSMSRTIPTVAGRNYTLSYSFRGPGIVGMWRAEGNANDSISTNNGVPTNVSFPLGEVGQAFHFDGALNPRRVKIADRPEFALTDSLSIEGWVRVLGNGSDIFWRGDNRLALDPYLVSMEDSNHVSFYIETTTSFQRVTAPINQNEWTHIAATLDGTSGNMRFYTNGVLSVQTNTALRPFAALDPTKDPSIGIGNLGETNNNFPFNGDIDEISLYGRALSASEVRAIYNAGAAGKFNQAVALPGALAEARVTLGILPPTTLFGQNTNWGTRTLAFVGSQAGVPLSVDGLQPGMLLDSFRLTEVPDDTYVLPETSLQSLIGQNAFGDWTLEVWDNRAGATQVAPKLISWNLRFVFETNTPNPIVLKHAVPSTNVVPAGAIAYYVVDVPAWARFATNTLVSASSAVNVLFGQTTPPIAGDTQLITGLAGVSVLDPTSTPPLVTGQRYYLGVQNTGPTASTVVLRVDFDVTPLANYVPVTSLLDPVARVRYFSFDVSPGAIAATFRLFNLDGNVDLVARKGGPLPELFDFDYGSFNPGTSNEDIIVVTNSTPVTLTPGTWYLGVFNRDAVNINYTIEAYELLTPLIIPLTNGVAFSYNNAPGRLPTNYFSFDITQSEPAVLFELYSLSGRGDLTADRNQLPLAPPYFRSSLNPGLIPEQIVVRTNLALTNLNAIWFLGVPNDEGTNITYIIRAVLPTNGMLISGQPLNVVITGPFGTNGPPLTWNAIDGEHYEIQISSNLFNWIVLTTITANGSTATFIDPTPVTGIPVRFYRIVQVP